MQFQIGDRVSIRVPDFKPNTTYTRREVAKLPLVFLAGRVFASHPRAHTVAGSYTVAIESTGQKYRVSHLHIFQLEPEEEPEPTRD